MSHLVKDLARSADARWAQFFEIERIAGNDEFQIVPTGLELGAITQIGSATCTAAGK